MNDAKNKLLVKIATQDKAPGLIANVYLAGKLNKTARATAVREFTKATLMNKEAVDFKQTLDSAWKGLQDWWSKDENKAGLATGALGALSTYGLTGLVPGLKNNTALRLGVAAAGGYGGFKGGQWGANKLMSDANAKGQLAQAAIDAQAAKDRESELGAERARLQDTINAANARAEQQAAEIAKIRGTLDTTTSDLDSVRSALGEANARNTSVQKELDAANSRNKELTDAGAAENAKYVAAGKAQEQKRMAESQQLVNAEFNKKLTGFVRSLLQNGPLTAEEGANQVAALQDRLTNTTDPEQRKLLENAIALIQKNTMTPVSAKPTFTFGGK